MEPTPPPRPERRCPRCAGVTPASVPSRWWRPAFAAGVLMVAAFTATALFIGTAIFALAPVYIVVGLCLGPLHRLATERATCLRCGAAVPARVPAPRAHASSREAEVAARHA